MSQDALNRALATDSRAVLMAYSFSKSQAADADLVGKTVVARKWFNTGTYKTVTARVIKTSHGEFQITWQERYGLFRLRTGKCSAWVRHKDILSVVS